METILTVRNEHLMLLDPEEAVDLFRELLWAEVRKIGIPLDRVNVSSWINLPDGGVDASIAEAGASLATSFIKQGHNSFQIKTGSSFSPWQKSQVKSELFGDKSPNKENLGSSVKACLDNNGVYVLVCFGQDLIDDQRGVAIGYFVDYFKQCGYENPRVDVWSLNNIISFLQPFPALALRANLHYRGRFEIYQEWASYEDMRKSFIAGEQQTELILKIQLELRPGEQPTHIRVWGEAGIGKTRLVLEATNTDDLRPLVVYCAAAQFRDSDLMTEILRGEFHAILILDECSPDNRAYIWNKLQYQSPRIRLISIYNERDDSSGITYFDVPPLGEDQISNIVQGYGIPKDQADRWASECSGSPRVAHVIGSNLINHPEDVLKPPGTVNIWERYITGLDDPQDLEVRQRRTVLRYLALYKRFGYGRPVALEAQAIAGLITRADPQITWERFQEIVKGLRDRRILQGENTLYLTPKLLHVKLWIDWWETYGEGFTLDDLTALPPELLNWFFEMFEYAVGSPAASQTVRSLLGEQGLFQQRPELLRGELGARFFRFLSKADPAAAIVCLKNTVGTWNKEELREFRTGRREVVWSLEEIARWKNIFLDAARLLLALGEAENETWSNNASGVFVELFSITEHRELSRTGASPQERFPVIKEAFESHSQERRALALRACNQALSRVMWGSVTDSIRIFGKSPELWAPTTYGELFDARRQVWGYLFSKLDDLPESERREVVDILLRNARILGWVGNLSRMVIETVEELSKKPYVDRKRILEVIVQILHYDGQHLPEDTRKSWEELRDRLTGTDFASLMKRYVGMSIVEDQFDENGARVDRARQWIEDLAQQAVERPNLLLPELEWLVTAEAQNGYQFGYELGKRDEELSILVMLTEAQKKARPNASGYFIGGYLRNLLEKDQQKWEELLDSFSTDEGLRAWVPEMTWRSGKLSDKAAMRVLQLVARGVVGIGHLRMFVYGAVIQELPEGAFKEWLELLLSHPDAQAVYIALDLFSQYYIGKDTRHSPPPDMTQKLLTSASLFRASEAINQDQMASYYWTLIGKEFISLYPERGVDLADVMLEHFEEKGTIFGGFHSETHSVLVEIVRQHPEEIWRRITKYLGPPIDVRAYAIKDWLRGEGLWDEEREGALVIIPPEAVWRWVDDDIENRAWYLASFVPKALFREESRICWARQVLVRYGEREDVRKNLIANFSTEGWTGPESLHVQTKKQQLLDFREGEPNENVRRWVDEFVSLLDHRIEQARITEEREEY